MQSAQAQGVEEIQRRLQALSHRDLQLWSIGLLVVLVLACGFVALVAPNLMWSARQVKVAGSYLPQLFFGFIALIVLFNIYVIGQRRELNSARQQLTWELMFDQRAHSLTLVDPLTQILNRRYLDYIIPKEVASANRHGAPLSFILFDLEDFRSINTRYGHKVGDALLVDTAKLLTSAFTANETVLRYGGDEFLVVVPDCGEEHAEQLAQHFLSQVKLWNESAGAHYRMAVSYGIASYRKGVDIKDVLQAAELSMERYRDQAATDRARRLNPECLLVTRDPQALEVIRPLFESMPVSVDTCGDLDEALHRLQQHRVEAILLDDDLGAVPEFVRKLRQSPGGRRAMVIALGHGCPQANFTLAKPLSPGAVARSLRVVHGFMLSERRRYFRHPLSTRVVLEFAPGAETVVTATDISEGGMALSCEQALVAGRQADLRFLLPGDVPLEVRAEVAWTDAAGHAGLRFLSMSEACRSALEKWLTSSARETERILATRQNERVEAAEAPPPGQSEAASASHNRV